ncbi:MAG: hypothetical protein H0U76_13910 [Ktedonobacteraceae bacterium]|nr:hypothetical protein [Ktedonobacteraceae bacterium]
MTHTEERIDWQQALDEALVTPGDMGSTYSRFYNYSYLNQVLLRLQEVREPVATYKRWQAIGRQVVKGAVAKEIVRPVIVQAVDGEGEKVQRLVGFKKTRSVFPLSDTVGEDLPTPEVPGWDIKQALGKLSIHEVEFDAINGNLQGYSRGTEIAINPIAVRPTKTRFHEIGHVVLGHTTGTQHEEYKWHRGILEFQAEATAYLAMKELGQLDEETAVASRGYIQHWLDGERPPDEVIRQVFVATDRIIQAGRFAIERAGAFEPDPSAG